MLLAFISLPGRFILTIFVLSLRPTVISPFVVIVKLFCSFTVIGLLVLALLITLSPAVTLLLIAFITSAVT
jgi:hypothetical protein